MLSFIENNNIFTIIFFIQTYQKEKASSILNDLCIVNVKLFLIEARVTVQQYQMKSSVVWIIRIYQAYYLWVKSQANLWLGVLRGVWIMGIFIDFFKHFIYSTVTTWKGSRKCHGRVMEKSLNFLLGFLYEPCNVVFVLKYWTQVLLCCVLPVKTPISWISSVLSIIWYFQV